MKDKDEEVANMAIKFFINITDTCPEWQVKILRDSALISDLLSLPENEDAWALLANLSTHPGMLAYPPFLMLLFSSL